MSIIVRGKEITIHIGIEVIEIIDKPEDITASKDR